MRLDAHQHFWALARGDYGWLTPELSALYRDFGPGDLTPLLQDHRIDGTILVQAAPTVAETQYMLGLAHQHDFIKGVVGWVDFEAPDAADQIMALARDEKLVGLRPMIQDIADPDWMLQPALTPAFEAMIAADLTFDALTLPQHLKNLHRLIERHPTLRVVIDHGSKPLIAKGVLEPWASDMAAIAQNTGAYVKMSGLVTEAGDAWTPDQLAPYVAHIIQEFGLDRVIWGSDWPVVTLACSYDDWITITNNMLTDLTNTERAAVWGGNAMRAYKLKMKGK